MTVSIIGCGQSAKDWHKVPCDLSIGVNDCEKWGKPVDWLVVVNHPNKFSMKAKNGFTDRLFTITNSKPKRFFCHNANWKPYFPNYEMLPLKHFSGSLLKDRIYKSNTSPFVAITMAYNQGPSDIILWGVDLLNHPNIVNKLLKTEISEYKRLFDVLQGKGINVWLGHPESVFKDCLKIWPVNVA